MIMNMLSQPYHDHLPQFNVLKSVPLVINASSDAEGWETDFECTCGRCNDLIVSEPKYCCDESEAISEVRQNYECITLTARFRDVIENKDILKLLRSVYSVHLPAKEKMQYRSRELDNDANRFLSYKFFNSLLDCHARGRYNRFMLPSCVTARIRALYPNEQGQYTGYKASTNGEALSYKDY